MTGPESLAARVGGLFTARVGGSRRPSGQSTCPTPPLPTVASFAPLPPAPTGVADYAASLLAGLQATGPAITGDGSADVSLYHIGNNSLHAAIYRRALARPGVVVLHDAVLHHFLLGALSEPDYVREFAHNYGQWRRGMALELWRDRTRSGIDERYFAFPMLRRLCEASCAVIVHNPAAAARVREHAPSASVIEIPHLFVPPEPPSDELAAFRDALSVPRSAFLFAVFGHLRETKRIAAVVRAFTRLRQERSDVLLLLAGPCASPSLQGLLADAGKLPGVRRLNYLEDERFWTAASAIDACLNLRYPSASETSGIMVRLMGIGRVLVQTDGDELSRLPEDACLRVPCGLGEEESLLATMRWLARNRDGARWIGQRAARHIRAHHSLDAVTRQYWRVLENAQRFVGVAR